jgi:hypothetical protein
VARLSDDWLADANPSAEEPAGKEAIWGWQELNKNAARIKKVVNLCDDIVIGWVIMGKLYLLSYH